MILRTQNRCAPKTLLPFNITKGSVKERNTKTWQYWNRFLCNFLQNKQHTIDTLKLSINRTLEPYQINYNIIQEKKASELGHTGVKVTTSPDTKGGLYIDRIGYEIGLQISQKDKKTLISDTTAVHEAYHFFDYLFNSKFACIKAKKLINHPDCDSTVEELRQIVLNNLSTKFNKKYFKQKIDDILNQLPDEVAIEALQKCRYSLKGEHGAITSEIKYLCKKNLIKNFRCILNTLAILDFCRYKAKEKIITLKLKNLIIKVRSKNKINQCD